MLLDTTFLIHLHREIEGGFVGRAFRFLEQNRDELLHVSLISLGEFAEGFLAEQDAVWRTRIGPYRLLGLDHETAWAFGQLRRRLRRENRLISDNDLWIAATALQHALPVVTSNVEHFERIDRLRVIAY